MSLSTTELSLLALYRSPVVPLRDVSQKYFGLSEARASELANLNLLPVPTHRLGASRKAPRMIHISDLAEHIDTQAAQARADWANSQI